MVNPWIIVGFLIALAAAVAGGYFKGESDGVTKQKVEDQAQFDAINKKLSDQKAEANARFKQDT